MSRRRKTLLAVLALLLAAGGFAWYWQATAVDRQVNALLVEACNQKRPLVERCLIKLALETPEQTIRRLRLHERTMRPLGEAGFIGKLERLLGRPLARRKPGAKLKKDKR